MREKSDIIFLGTGNALATRCYNTCFIVRSQGGMLMVDAGGGNGILRQLELADIKREDIHDLFVTHAHTDHILGVVWMVRMALQFQSPNPLRIHSHRKVLDVLTYVCRQLLPCHEAERIGSVVELHEVRDGDSDIFQPYEKHHSTTLDAARLAEQLSVKNLILYQ
jgi:ribonuclease Z